MTDYGTLTDYTTGEEIRPATREEHARSLAAGGPEVTESEPKVSAPTTTTLTVPTDTDPYTRWLAGRLNALAHRLRAGDETIDEATAEMARVAVDEMSRALAMLSSEGRIR